jgi:predicted AAA+ superfamily ATPase
LELKAFRSYRDSDLEIFYWRTQTGQEVDFVLRDKDGELTGIEVKATQFPQEADLKGLRALDDVVSLKRKILLCNAERARKTSDEIEILPVMKFVNSLWQR